MTISPTPEQSAAIKAIVEWYGNKHGPQEFYLAGYAGVGKTTIAAFAIEEIKKKRRIKKVRTAAYTGKAASVLRRKGIEDAQTIHSLIYKPKVNRKTGELRGFSIAKDGDAADADLIVLDECSMVDEKLASDLRSFDQKILIMGDPGQLPPVKGQGAFTNRAPDIFLQEIHRQAADSPILELATLARQGKPLPLGYRIG
jgi:exodeoxyribonuclease V